MTRVAVCIFLLLGATAVVAQTARQAADRVAAAAASDWVLHGFTLESAVGLDIDINETGTIVIDKPVGSGTINVSVNIGEVLMSIVVGNDINSTNNATFVTAISTIANTDESNVRVLDISEGTPLAVQGSETYSFGLASGEYSGATVAFASDASVVAAPVPLTLLLMLMLSRFS